jgi:hypothetical protein
MQDHYPTQKLSGEREEITMIVSESSSNNEKVNFGWKKPRRNQS